MRTLGKKILRFLTKKILNKYNPDVVGITGSVGKTSVKEITEEILNEKFRVRASIDSYNTKLGLILTVIGERSPGSSVWGWLKIILKGFKLWFKKYKDYPEILLLEMAANKPGDIKYLTEMAPCCIGVVTVISPVHMKFFKTLKKIIREKRQVVSHLTRTDFAVLNRDDTEVFEMRKKTDADIISFGFHPESNVRVSDVNLKINPETGWPEGVFFKVIHKGSVVPMYLKGVVGEHSVYPVLAATSIALVFGFNLVEVSNVLKNIDMPPGRMRLLPGIKNTLIIDDSYNSSPVAVKVGLEALSRINIGEGKERYAVLGDMLELGKETKSKHREVGLRTAELGIDYLITVGQAMKIAATAAQEVGLSEHRIASFSNTHEAGKFLQEKLRSGDVVLIKGSRAVEMEKIVKEVMANPLDADKKLVG